MDRPLERSHLRRQALIRALKTVVVVGLLAGGLVTFRGFMAPKVHRSAIRTAIVSQDSIQETITASGIVVPQYEEIVSSPIESRVLKILKRPGDTVETGEPIVELDTSGLRLEIDNLREQIALKENELVAAELAMENSLLELTSERDLRKIDHKIKSARNEREQALFEDGLGAASLLQETRLDVDRANIEVAKIEQSINNLGKRNCSEIERIEMESNILKKEKTDRIRLLKLARMGSPRNGILTSVVEVEGMSVGKGEQIARIADLSTFKIEATVSDVYSPRLLRGLPIRVRVNETYLDGTLETVLPAIEEGTAKLIVQLSKPSYADLRANLRVDVHIITDSRDQTLVIKSGPSINGSGIQSVFIVRDGLAYQTDIVIGLVSFDHVEILEGAKSGDEVIISDMSKKMHVDVLRVTGNQ